MICPRCKREAVGWPLSRPDTCSPKDWQVCIREPAAINAVQHWLGGCVGRPQVTP